MNQGGGLPPALRLVGIGWTVIAGIALGLLVGWGLDAALDTGDAFLVIGLFVGLFFGLLSAWIQLREVLDAINRRQDGG